MKYTNLVDSIKNVVKNSPARCGRVYFDCIITRKDNITIVKLTPKTGRTHQLRAHMTYISHPIVGDIVYGSKIDSPRIMLHASNLKFRIGDKDFEFEVGIPEEFLS